MNAIKIFLTLPLFLWIIIKINRKFKQKNKKKSFEEKSNYLWTKRYARYLLWLYNYKLNTKFLPEWGEKSTFLILKNNKLITGLALLKLNNFKYHAPITFLWTKNSSKPKIIWKFLHLINDFNFEKNNKTEINKAVQNIKIPRTAAILINYEEKDKCQWLDVAYGGLANVIILNVEFIDKKINFIVSKVIDSKKLPQINRDFITKNIFKN